MTDLTKDKLEKIIEDVYNTEPIKSETKSFDAWYDSLSNECKYEFHIALIREAQKMFLTNTNNDDTINNPEQI